MKIYLSISFFIPFIAYSLLGTKYIDHSVNSYLCGSNNIQMWVNSFNEIIGSTDFQITKATNKTSIPTSTSSAPPPPYIVYPTPSSGTFRGQAQIGGIPASDGDWVAAIDSDGNTAGAAAVIFNSGVAYINLTIYGDDFNTPFDEGMNSGEYFTLQLFDASENAYLDYPNSSLPDFTAWINTNGAPIPAYSNINSIYNFITIIMPVHLMQFDVSLDNHMSVILSWLTASEENSSHFIIEHSTDGEAFSEIGRVDAAGNSITEISYEFIHEYPKPNVNYYRLKAIDLDDSFEYSEVRTMTLPRIYLLEVNLAPIPAKEKLNVSIDCRDEDYTIDIQISNIEGKILESQTIKSSEEISLDVSDYPSGNYVFIYSIDGKSKSQKFMIAK